MATHGVVPEVPIMTGQTYAAPLSYVGSTRRMVTWARKDRSAWAEVAAWTGVVLGLALAWALVTVWYLLIFGVFGLFVFPYRLIRRSQRKAAQVQRVQLATMQAMMAGQMNQQQVQAPQAQAPQIQHPDEGQPPLRAVQ